MCIKIWKDFNSLYMDVKRNRLQHQEISRLAKEWARLYLTIYHSKNITPYIHIFIHHLCQFNELHFDVNSFNMQGLEKLNDMTTRQYFSATNKKEKEFLKQILNKRNRIEYLSSNYRFCIVFFFV